MTKENLRKDVLDLLNELVKVEWISENTLADMIEDSIAAAAPQVVELDCPLLDALAEFGLLHPEPNPLDDFSTEELRDALAKREQEEAEEREDLADEFMLDLLNSIDILDACGIGITVNGTPLENCDFSYNIEANKVEISSANIHTGTISGHTISAGSPFPSSPTFPKETLFRRDF